ncbi:MAG: glycosyltransferase [Candidatus Eremiobacteraeota bacterium]|nr:glycosyltransferase [Candidatus Eremiobacteraeota bacterium]MBV8497900.1 glycosyltransferase [Candidatus Eremiobacteraeota bacterium]
MPEISVVIPTYNRLDTLASVIPTLLAQDLAPAQYELIVCDSNSDDGTDRYLAAVAMEHPNVRHVAADFGGRAGARNAGITAARGDVVLFNDADILASPDLLSTHLRRHHEERGAAIVGLEVQVRDMDEYRYKRDHPAARGHLHPPSRKKLSWLYFLTGNASVRRDDLIAVGCFDENFTGYGHEDLELGYRLEKAGVRILYEPRAVSYHCQAVAYEDQKAKMRLAGRSTARFYRKHPDFAVMLNLGMTPVSLGLHSLLTRLPRALAFIDGRADRSRLARELLLQYHYVSGIKEGRAGDER